jgi:hypothetical protein
MKLQNLTENSSEIQSYLDDFYKRMESSDKHYETREIKSIVNEIASEILKINKIKVDSNSDVKIDGSDINLTLLFSVGIIDLYFKVIAIDEENAENGGVAEFELSATVNDKYVSPNDKDIPNIFSEMVFTLGNDPNSIKHIKHDISRVINGLDVANKFAQWYFDFCLDNGFSGIKLKHEETENGVLVWFPDFPSVQIEEEWTGPLMKIIK